ncbi:hypothetical protein ACRALDRAFT_209985 [Sodiomyces alcalophilus JCM 7366]|uniref:uncharacterized protein n=1 Tax=Sodiomyces alcalophilus JCM 7366 TaxID=591952 RepID=UPI0039B45609
MSSLQPSSGHIQVSLHTPPSTHLIDSTTPSVLRHQNDSSPCKPLPPLFPLSSSYVFLYGVQYERATAGEGNMGSSCSRECEHAAAMPVGTQAV